MQTLPFNIQRPDFFSNFESPFLSKGLSFSFIKEFHKPLGREDVSVKESPDDALSNYTVNDYRVGKADTLHATMVFEFLRLFCQEEPSTQAADAVLIVDIQGCIHGYGYRHDSSFADLFAELSGSLITELLSENMKRQWLNQNIDSIALQRRHWRLFRLHDSGTAYMILMEFHPVEIQRTALVLWVLES